MRIICCLGILIGLTSAKTGWKPLFNGKTLEPEWTKVGAQNYWSVDPADSSIVGSSGGVAAPKSLLATVDAGFEQYTVKYSYRLKAGCSGFFFQYNMNAEGKTEAVQIEAKLTNGKMQEVGSLYVMPAPGWAVQHSDAWSTAAAPDPNAWQKVLLTVKKPYVYVNVNGKQAVGETDAALLAAGAKPAWNYTGHPFLVKPGKFAVQIHEGEVMDVKFKDIAILEGCGDASSPNFDGNFVPGFPKQAAVYRDNGTCTGTGLREAGAYGAVSGGDFPGRVVRRDGWLTLEVAHDGPHSMELLTLDGKPVFSASSPRARTYEVTRPLPSGIYLAVFKAGFAVAGRKVVIP